ncbi:hypothetical protein FTO68_00010 [Methanocalculus taiwanensis]|uniref:Uncharacterized protein n=1 Tax=Methanocalculus taiwanensis TaxID=106207 RepID=A0ABD4TED4_9EURY|nr:hypothetical protein [Methanocalculus taiwanensis]MCQ1537394.1 hypothetical protein [Methanocalculus taiwanensis]
MSARFILVPIVCICCIFAAGCTGSPESHDSYQSSYSYEATISFTEPLHNVTLLLPYPAPGFDPLLSEIYGLPDGWDAQIIAVNTTPFLSITAAEMIPRYHGMPIAIEPGEENLPPTLPPSDQYSEETPILRPVSFGIRYDPGRTIQTKHPEGTDPLLPHSTSEGTCAILGMGGEPCTAITSPVYLSYESSPDTSVEVWVRFSGSNEWWSLGWSGNSYSQLCSIQLTGPQDGWNEMQGDMVVGSGRY